MMVVKERGHMGPDDRGARARMVPLLLLILFLALSHWVPALATAEDPATGQTVFHQIIMNQGDNPDTAEMEPRDLIVVTDRTYWRIPWEVDTVFTFIPVASEHVLCDNVAAFPHQNQTIFIPGEFSAAVNPDDPPESGVVGGGDYHGMVYWSFPAGADRYEVTSLVFSTDEDWEDFDANLTDGGEWSISSGGLSMAANLTEATYTSKRYTGGVGIASVNMTVGSEAKENLSFEVTWDDGTTWHPIEEGDPLSADGSGNAFRWRLTMNRGRPEDATPVLDGVTYDVTFAPEETVIWLETTYHVRIPAGGPFDLRTVFPFDDTSSGLIFLAYFDNDMVLEANGTAVTKEVDGTYPGKTTYFHMQGPHEETITFTITDLSEAEEASWEPLLAVAILVVVILVVAAVYVTRRGAVAVVAPSEGMNEEGEDDAGEVDGEPSGIQELEKTKADILEEISELDRTHEEGGIDDGEHRTRRAELKAEAVEVMKELGALDR